MGKRQIGVGEGGATLTIAGACSAFSSNDAVCLKPLVGGD